MGSARQGRRPLCLLIAVANHGQQRVGTPIPSCHSSCGPDPATPRSVEALLPSPGHAPSRRNGHPPATPSSKVCSAPQASGQSSKKNPRILPGSLLSMGCWALSLGVPSSGKPSLTAFPCQAEWACDPPRGCPCPGWGSVSGSAGPVPLPCTDPPWPGAPCSPYALGEQVGSQHQPDFPQTPKAGSTPHPRRAQRPVPGPRPWWALAVL